MPNGWGHAPAPSGGPRPSKPSGKMGTYKKKLKKKLRQNQKLKAFKRRRLKTLMREA